LRKVLCTFLLIISIVSSPLIYAQDKKDACELITTSQINRIIGCKVKEGKAVMNGQHCGRRSADDKVSVSMEYYDWKTPGTALYIMKTIYDEDSKNIAQGKKAVGVYSTIELFSVAGDHALIMTGKADANDDLVRIQFVIGRCNFTFDTQGIEKGLVVSKAEEIFDTIRTNYKK
jgi:hypothetical protein